MRVLEVNKYHRIRGGADRVYFQTQDILSRHGHEVIPFASRGGHGESESPYSSFFVDDLIGEERLNLGEQARVAARAIYNLQARSRLDKLIRQTRPHIAHVHNIHYQISPSVFHTLRRRDVPAVMTLHDYRLVCPNGYLYTQGAVCERCGGGRFYNAFLHRCLRGSWGPSLLGSVAAYVHQGLEAYSHVSRYITTSSFLRQKMIEFGLPSEKLVHIPVPLDATAIPPRFGGDRYFVMSGFVTPQKGPHIAIDAIQRTKGGRLVVVGDGPFLEALKRWVEEEKIGSVHFAGFLDGAKLWDVVGGSISVIVPSLWHEVLGMVVLEGYALGKPVIATRVGGLPEVVLEGQTGFLVAPGDVDGLAQAMQVLLDDPRRAVEMGKAGRQFVTERFTPDMYYDRLVSIFEEVRESR